MVIRKKNPQCKIVKVGGREMRVPIRTPGAGNLTGSSLQSWDSGLPTSQDQGSGCLCFFLGGFGPIGILIAAVIAKREGVISALWGCLFSGVVGLLTYFAIAYYFMR